MANNLTGYYIVIKIKIATLKVRYRGARLAQFMAQLSILAQVMILGLRDGASGLGSMLSRDSVSLLPLPLPPPLPIVSLSKINNS